MSLSDLGLTSDEEGVYRALLALGVARSANQLVVSGLEADAISDALLALRDKGYADRRPDDRAWVPAPPALALGAQVAARRDELHRVELAMAEMVEQYRSGSLSHLAGDLVEVVEGGDAVRNRYVQIQLAARHRIDTLVTGVARAVGPAETKEATVLDRGVRLRAVLDQGFVSSTNALANIEESLEGGAVVRTIEDVPMKLVVCDGEVALFPLNPASGEVDPSLVVRGGLAKVAQALFDSVWQLARPYGQLGPDIAQLDTRILRLLLVGLTDDAVAGQLGLSSRTVQRRVQALMSLAGVTTRIQLGWHAARYGWA